MAIDLINDMCKVLCMYMYLTRCKNIPLSHINVNAIMKGKYFIYVPVISNNLYITFMTDWILSVWYFGGEFECTGEAL